LIFSPDIPVAEVSAKEKTGIDKLKALIIEYSPKEFSSPSLLGDFLSPGDFAVLVCPIDTSAPKGRLILPQVQAIRDALDSDCIALVTKEHELRWALDNIKVKPKLVVTDSQVFSKVSADTPADIKLTSFSILMARLKGDLEEMIRGIGAVKTLKPGDKVLISEACTHHKQADDIGTVKIPRWLSERIGGKLEIDVVSGTKYPDNLEEYKLIIHCGGCMINRKEMLYRIYKAKENDIPIINYGVLIAYLHGIMPRAIEIFPFLHELYDDIVNMN
jgi:[FeFe] hydrogenase H-cluster maturation GTPase HydF